MAFISFIFSSRVTHKLHDLFLLLRLHFKRFESEGCGEWKLHFHLKKRSNTNIGCVHGFMRRTFNVISFEISLSGSSFGGNLIDFASDFVKSL